MKRYFSKEDFICFLNLLEADKYSKVFVEYVEDGSTEEVNFLKIDFKGKFTYEVILYDHPSGRWELFRTSLYLHGKTMQKLSMMTLQ